MNYELLNVQSCETNAPSDIISNGEIADINEFSIDGTLKIYQVNNELWFQSEETHKSFK